MLHIARPAFKRGNGANAVHQVGGLNKAIHIPPKCVFARNVKVLIEIGQSDENYLRAHRAEVVRVRHALESMKLSWIEGLGCQCSLPLEVTVKVAGSSKG